MAAILLGLGLLHRAAGAWESVFISNTAPRTVGAGGPIVGAQDGNLLAVPTSEGGGFALIGMSYGNCLFTACQNTTVGNCGFGAGAIHVWRSPSLGQADWRAPVELLPAAQRPAGSASAGGGSAPPQKHAAPNSTPAKAKPAAAHAAPHHSRLLAGLLSVTVCGSTRPPGAV